MTRRYFKRAWDEMINDSMKSWGTSVWYFEVGIDAYPIRQIEVFENGNRLKYHESKLEDDYGGLGDQPLELDEFQEFEIKKEEFESEWSRPEFN